MNEEERDLLDELGQVLLLATARTEEQNPPEHFHLHRQGTEEHLPKLCRACTVIKRWEEWRRNRREEAWTLNG